MTYYDKENGFPFSHFISDTKSGLIKCKELANILPHGSGINGDWKIKKTGNKFICSNYFEAMTEYGMYCHNYDFTIYIRLNDGKFEYIDKLNFHGQNELKCCGYDLKSYIDDTISEFISYNQDKIKAS